MSDRNAMLEENAPWALAVMDARRCPYCAPGHSSGAECRHHWLATRPKEQFRQKVEADMSCVKRRLITQLEAAMLDGRGDFLRWKPLDFGRFRRGEARRAECAHFYEFRADVYWNLDDA